jgi:hypothetical protein
LVSFCQNYRSSSNNWATFFNGKSYVSIITKIDWATFWATFSQTPLVTLPERDRAGNVIFVIFEERH